MFIFLFDLKKTLSLERSYEGDFTNGHLYKLLLTSCKGDLYVILSPYSTGNGVCVGYPTQTKLTQTKVNVHAQHQPQCDLYSTSRVGLLALRWISEAFWKPTCCYLQHEMVIVQRRATLRKPYIKCHIKGKAMSPCRFSATRPTQKTKYHHG